LQYCKDSTKVHSILHRLSFQGTLRGKTDYWLVA
jgi:hypothetical protein